MPGELCCASPHPHVERGAQNIFLKSCSPPGGDGKWLDGELLNICISALRVGEGCTFLSASDGPGCAPRR